LIPSSVLDVLFEVFADEVKSPVVVLAENGIFVPTCGLGMRVISGEVLFDGPENALQASRCVAERSA